MFSITVRKYGTSCNIFFFIFSLFVIYLFTFFQEPAQTKQQFLVPESPVALYHGHC